MISASSKLHEEPRPAIHPLMTPPTLTRLIWSTAADRVRVSDRSLLIAQSDRTKVRLLEEKLLIPGTDIIVMSL